MQRPLLLLREVNIGDLIQCTNLKTERRFTGWVTEKDDEGIYLYNHADNYYAKYALFDYQKGELK